MMRGRHMLLRSCNAVKRKLAVRREEVSARVMRRHNAEGVRLATGVCRSRGSRQEGILLKVVGLALLFTHAPHAASSPSPVEGSYVAQSLNGRAVPTDLRVPTTEGDFRLFRLEQAVLRLNGDHRFTLYFRYHHQLVRRGARPVMTPVMSESEEGVYTVRGTELSLIPGKQRGNARRPKTIAATIGSGRIRAQYVLQNGGAPERITLLLALDPTFW
jgi:hypothetical protein